MTAWHTIPLHEIIYVDHLISERSITGLPFSLVKKKKEGTESVTDNILELKRIANKKRRGNGST